MLFENKKTDAGDEWKMNIGIDREETDMNTDSVADVDGVVIIKANPLALKGFQGPPSQWESITRQIISWRKKAGTIIEGHVHSSSDERLFISKGRVKIHFLRPGNSDFRHSRIIEEGDSVVIKSGWAHKLEILEDVVICEFRTGCFGRDNPDTSPAEV
ncbi:hypothetical protein KKC00_02365 [Patescibacteria group bacterium]|nr:hypothetical protein [Patescibacteria group bacterium]